MGDLIFLIIVLVFFAVTVLFVKACDSIIGPDPDVSSTTDTEATPPPNVIVVVDGVQQSGPDLEAATR